MAALGCWRYESGRTFYALSTRDLVKQPPNHHPAPATQIRYAHEFLQLSRTNSIYLYNWQKNRASCVARQLRIEHLKDLTTKENLTRLMEVFLETWPCWQRFNLDERQAASDVLLNWLSDESVNRWFDENNDGDAAILWDETHYPAPEHVETRGESEMSEKHRSKPQHSKSREQQAFSAPKQNHNPEEMNEEHDYEQEDGFDRGNNVEEQSEEESVEEEERGWQAKARYEFVKAEDESSSDLYRVIHEYKGNSLQCGQIVQLRQVGKNPVWLYVDEELDDHGYRRGTRHWHPANRLEQVRRRRQPSGG